MTENVTPFPGAYTGEVSPEKMQSILPWNDMDEVVIVARMKGEDQDLIVARTVEDIPTFLGMLEHAKLEVFTQSR